MMTFLKITDVSANWRSSILTNYKTLSMITISSL